MTTRKEPPREGTIGRVIYDARRKRGISQAELSRRIGTSRRNIIRWESNQTRPGRDYSEALATELRVALNKILDPSVAHVRRSQDARVIALLNETAVLRAENDQLRKENADLRRLLRKAS